MELSPYIKEKVKRRRKIEELIQTALKDLILLQEALKMLDKEILREISGLETFNWLGGDFYDKKS